MPHVLASCALPAVLFLSDPYGFVDNVPNHHCGRFDSPHEARTLTGQKIHGVDVPRGILCRRNCAKAWQRYTPTERNFTYDGLIRALLRAAPFFRQPVLDKRCAQGAVVGVWPTVAEERCAHSIFFCRRENLLLFHPLGDDEIDSRSGCSFCDPDRPHLIANLNPGFVCFLYVGRWIAPEEREHGNTFRNAG